MLVDFRRILLTHALALTAQKQISQPADHPLRVILIGELFLFQIYDIFFAQLFNLPYFPGFVFPNVGMITNLIFLLLEIFTNSDKTPRYIEIHISKLFPNLGNYEKNALR